MTRKKYIFHSTKTFVRMYAITHRIYYSKNRDVLRHKESSGGQACSRVNSPKDSHEKNLIFFSNSSFCRIFSFCPISVLCDLHINLSSAPHTQPHHTKLWGNVRHIPTHPPAPPWCMLRLGFSHKNHLFTQHTLFFCSLKALELVF